MLINSIISHNNETDDIMIKLMTLSSNNQIYLQLFDFNKLNWCSIGVCDMFLLLGDPYFKFHEAEVRVHPCGFTHYINNENGGILIFFTSMEYLISHCTHSSNTMCTRIKSILND